MKDIHLGYILAGLLIAVLVLEVVILATPPYVIEYTPQTVDYYASNNNPLQEGYYFVTDAQIHYKGLLFSLSIVNLELNHTYFFLAQDKSYVLFADNQTEFNFLFTFTNIDTVSFNLFDVSVVYEENTLRIIPDSFLWLDALQVELIDTSV